VSLKAAFHWRSFERYFPREHKRNLIPEFDLKISVIIPAFNEEKLLPATLTSVRAAMAAFTARGWETELVVCDNNSTDKTSEIAKAAGASVVFETVNQIARARNTGAAAATGDWLVFVDADSHPSRELFDNVAKEMASGTCSFGGSTVKLNGRHRMAEMSTALWNLISRVMRYAAGSFIFCETAAFRQIGGFDNRLFASEEIDLSQRLKKLARAHGKRAVILHRHPMLTSDRKVRLYSGRELLSFIFHAVLSPRRTVASREACSPWYDGRR
jgi:glycosyltransferase involved in cell wall biosynthesis